MHCLHSCTRHAASLSVGIATTLLPPPAIVFTPAPVRTSNLDNKRREGVLVRGRRDGNSSHRKEQQRRRRQRIRMSEDNWWEEDGRLKEDMLTADFVSEVPQRRGRGSKKDEQEEEEGQVSKSTHPLHYDMVSRQCFG
uniref:Uncharacterized protein n=1 Tax=Dunaliella tertiolecta TaxID=3047 RepID=A0A7S3R993_DUNTE